MYKLNEKIHEIEFNISRLKKTAEKHLLNDDSYRFRVINETIQDNEKQLLRMKIEEQNANRKQLWQTLQ